MKKLLEFTAPWCKACKAIEPIVKAASQNVTVQVVDVSVDEATAQKYGVQNLPTVILLENDEIVCSVSGAGNGTVAAIREFAGL